MRFLRRTLFISGMSAGIVLQASAQISPGELSSAHANLEGMSNCTQCHALGKTISSERCLACHTQIQTRLVAKTGLHGKNNYQQCIDCHKEHHGRDFSIRRLDTKSFDHSLTGYVLKGKHNNLECEKCHEAPKIKSADIAQQTSEFKSRTYLGLLQECGACHRDIHAGQLSHDCQRCHTLDGWKPAANFSHDRAGYKLTGKHMTVECAACHKKTLENNTTVQYVHLEFASCSSCHADPHKGKFDQSCQSCHTTDGWNEGQAKTFDHSLTRFPLHGKHSAVKCEQCHAGAAKKGKKVAGAFSIAKFKNCSDCHADAHAGQFAHRADHGKCESCHTEDTFLPSTYSASDHGTSRFELTGAHLATACTACHVSGAKKAKSSRLFRWESDLQCITCHKDAHGGQFQSNPKKNCEACHTTVAWNSLLFSHETTRFPLRGKHAEISCAKCHTSSGKTTEIVQYRVLTVQCNSCHKDEHEGQFAQGETTDCARCHSVASWKIVDFNHTLLTRYELTGKHVSVSCVKCHIPATINGRTTTRYKPLGTACADCHAGGNGHESK